MTMSEDVGAMLQKGLSEWWSEETEYLFQRIERWAAYARGYNRLRSQRLSRGRMTMQGKQEPRWSISSNKLIIENSSWNPRFHTLKKSRRKSCAEETKINCCGTFNYQSNSNLDNSCLETYRYDHSIYFKTIGDIKNSKKDVSDVKNEQEDRISISSEELVEWDVESVSDFIANTLLEDGFTDVDIKNMFDSSENPGQDTDQIDSPVSSNVDLTKLNLNENNDTDATTDDQDDDNNVTIFEKESNNNYIRNTESSTDPVLLNQTQLNCVSEHLNNKGQPQNQQGITRFFDGRRNRRGGRAIKQAPIVGDNDVIWPSVLLNYTKNIDPSNSPYNYRESQK